MDDSSLAIEPSDAAGLDARLAADAGDADATALLPASEAATMPGPDARDAGAQGSADAGDGTDAAAADAGQSLCQSFEILCRGGCVDPKLDRAHCGRCDAPCAADESCFGGTCAEASGCSDGAREAFTDRAAFPSIAGCAASWSLSSMNAPPTNSACGNGLEWACAVPADACSSGWHVCGLRGPRELSDRLTQGECVSPPGRFAAALSDHFCQECGNGGGYGAVCCGANCKIEGGDCVWPEATPWFGLDADGYIMACAAIHNPLEASQGVLCCHDE